MVNFGKEALRTYSRFELLETGLNTVMTNMGESTRAGTELFERLRKFSLQTTFGVETLAGVAKEMLTVGVATDELEEKIMQLGNIAGGSTSKFEALSSVYTKVLATGRANALQIRQLSRITGTSFVKALGKTNASAEELSELFEKLTEEGGMFNGAMEALNETLSGKQEFVVSTWAEFLAQFAELSGLADVSKKILEVVYDILQKIVDKMVEMQDNALFKAMLQGTLVGGITALATAIAIPLVMAFKSATVALAGLIGVSGPVALAILGISAGVGILSGVIVKHISEVNAQKEANERLNETLRIQAGYYETLEGDAGRKETQKAVDDINEELKTQLDLLNKIKQKYDEINGMQTYDDEVYIKRKRVLLKITQKEYDEQLKIVKTLEDRSKKLTKVLEIQKKLTDSQKKASETKSFVDELFEGMKTSDEKALEEYQSQLEKIKDAYNEIIVLKENVSKSYFSKNGIAEAPESGFVITEKKLVDFDPEFKTSLDKADELLEQLIKKQEEKVNESKAKASMTDYQEFLLSTIGMTFEDYKKKHPESVKNGKFTLSTGTLADDIENSMKEIEEIKKKYETANDGILASYYPRDIHTEYADIREAIRGYITAITDEASIVKDKTGGVTAKGVRYANVGELDINTEALNKLIELEKTLTEEMEKDGDKKFQAFLQSKFSALIKEDNAQSLKGANYKRSDSLKYEIDLISSEIDRLIELGLSPTSEELKLLSTNLKSATSVYEQVLYEEKQQALQENINKTGAFGFSEKEQYYNEMYQNAREKGDIDTMKSAYLNGSFMGGMGSLTNDTDVGMFAELSAQMGPLTALLAVVMRDIFEIIGGLDGVEVLLNPIRITLQAMKPMLQAIVNMLLPIAEVLIGILAPIVEILGDFLTPIIKTLGYVLKIVLLPLQAVAIGLRALASFFTGKLEEWEQKADESTAEIDKYYKATKNLTQTTEDLTSKYMSLLQAIQANEDYYLERKTKLSAQAYLESAPVKKVNDMVITPSGRFSTDPNDYIFAMKDPSILNQNMNNNTGNVVVNMPVEVKNEMGKDAEINVARENDNGMDKLVIKISRKIANDMATGANGWDSAYSTQQQRLAGRRVSI